MAASPRLRFAGLWRRLGADGPSDDAFDSLTAAYGEAGRAYHTLDHILDCLARLDESEISPAERDLVEAAIWLHDVVYDPRRSDNEARSAEWAARALSAAGVRQRTATQVHELIRMTDHAAEAAGPGGRLLCDIDLSILGRDERQFDDYQRRIREEYAWVPEPEYRDGRARFLSALLGRPRIYLTDAFHDRYETAARRNLQGALARLEP